MSESGEFRVDLHVKVLNDDVVGRAKAAGLDAVVYAPHFTHLSTVRERAERYGDDDLLVVPAREYFTGHWSERKHVLAVDPDEPVPDFLSLEDTMAELDRQDAAVLVPHPGFLTVSLARDEVLAYRDVVDSVEVYCPKYLAWHGRRAQAIADEADLPTFTSSYAHLQSTVGAAWVEFEESFGSAAELAAALRRGAPRSLHRGRGPRHWLRAKAEFAHLGWENTWRKVKRVALEGTEPTHPRAPEYGGRFDELSVY